MTGSLDGLFWVFGASTLLFVVLSLCVNVNNSEYQLITPEVLEQHEEGLERISSRERLLATTPMDNSEKQSSANRHPINYSSINNSNSHYVDLFKSDSVTSAHTIREEADETLGVIGGVDLGLAISRIASIDQSMVGLVNVTSEDIPSPGSIFKSVRVLTFLVTTLLFGFVLSIIVNFLFLFLGRDLQMPASWIGWTGPTTGITELLCFCFSKQVSTTSSFNKTFLFICFLSPADRNIWCYKHDYYRTRCYNCPLFDLYYTYP